MQFGLLLSLPNIWTKPHFKEGFSTFFYYTVSCYILLPIHEHIPSFLIIYFYASLLTSNF